MDILQAIKHESLFRPYLQDKQPDLRSWSTWRTALACLYGLPVPPRYQDRVQELTGRSYGTIPKDGFDQALFLTGRRSGKSRISSVIAAYEATVGGKWERLAKGETGIVAIVSPTVKQSRVIKRYVAEVFDSTPVLKQQFAAATAGGVRLKNGVQIEILAGDFRSVRGYTLLAAIVDEAAFFGVEADAKVKSDTELMRAVLPALATTGGKLIAISSPYAKRGWCWNTHKDSYGNPAGDTLVVNASSTTMNPTLPRAVVAKALRKDRAAANAEYLGQFRDDVAGYITPELVEQCIAPGRTRMPYSRDQKYSAFCDLSGGRNDDAALAISHKENGRIVIDQLLTWSAPFDPRNAIRDMIVYLRDYQVRRVHGDRYAASFVSEQFRDHRVAYQESVQNKSELYIDLLPLLTTRGVELPDNKKLVNQLVALERRTRSGGRDTVDHPDGGHDDLANVVAGACAAIAKAKRRVGVLKSALEA